MLQRRLLRCPFGKRLHELRQAERQPSHHRVCERDRALESRVANELDRLVDGRVHRNLRVGELVGTEPQGGSNRRVELAHGPPAESLDPVVEGADALDRPVGQPLSEGTLARLEPGSLGRESAIGVGLLLEHALDGLERRPPRRRRAHFRPRRNSS